MLNKVLLLSSMWVHDCQPEYKCDVIMRAKTDPKLLHSCICERKVGSPSVGPLRLDSGTLSDRLGEMAEIFATSFASVFTQTGPLNPSGC